MMVNGRMWGEADMVSDQYYIIIWSITYTYRKNNKSKYLASNLLTANSSQLEQIKYTMVVSENIPIKKHFPINKYLWTQYRS